jgi:hypothetical protein
MQRARALRAQLAGRRHFRAGLAATAAMLLFAAALAAFAYAQPACRAAVAPAAARVRAAAAAAGADEGLHMLQAAQPELVAALGACARSSVDRAKLEARRGAASLRTLVGR